MSQLSLNLIAVSVFVMTMSALLGPLIDLSPVVPAIATASILGLAAIDTFNWQGRGSTILLDGLAGFSAEHRDRVLRHEAGHFLVAHRLHIPVTDYTLSAWESFRRGQAGQGGVQFNTQELDAELQQGSLSAQLLDRYCTIWMAGSAAEHLTYGNVQGGADDFQKLRMILSRLQFSPAAIQQKERWSALQAKTLLQDHWETYEALIAAMQRRAPVEECLQILESSASESIGRSREQ
ncbi:MAG: ATP-dependent Zn protease [Oscillatoriales cyanobacterium C42_A2020_001]|nr:ATP-dependent Zn protease [Leptolyngbyaceae cyanobacterium C42_A2020_001]